MNRAIKIFTRAIVIDQSRASGWLNQFQDTGIPRQNKTRSPGLASELLRLSTVPLEHETSSFPGAQPLNRDRRFVEVSRVRVDNEFLLGPLRSSAKRISNQIRTSLDTLFLKARALPVSLEDSSSH